MKAHAFSALQVSDDIEQVARLGISLWPEHSHEALRRDARQLAKALKSHRAVDVVAQQRLARVDVTGEQAVDGFLQLPLSAATQRKVLWDNWCRLYKIDVDAEVK